MRKTPVATALGTLFLLGAVVGVAALVDEQRHLDGRARDGTR
jgi:hypothetical protein